MEAQTQYTIAADSAYPLTRSVLKPFGQNATPTEAHVEFNLAQRRLRNACTEKIFGQLKSRFRILRDGMELRIDTCQVHERA